MSTDKHKNETSWERGESPNPNGRPKGVRGKPVSKLRSTLRKLQEMEADALNNIKESISRKAVDKEAIATSKWLISTIVSVNRAASADETVMLTSRIHDDELKMREEELAQASEEKKEGTTGNVIRFSTKMPVPSDDEDEDEE